MSARQPATAEPLRVAVPKHAFAVAAEGRLCAECGLSGINPVHRHDPYDVGPISSLARPRPGTP